MAKLRPFQTSLNAGELSPLLRGRQDVTRYQNGLEKCRNALPLLLGGCTRRPGRKHVAPATTAGEYARLIPFNINVAGVLVGYQVELCDGAMRFFRNDDTLLETGGAPIEIATGWSDALVRELHYHAFDNILYLTHNSIPPQRLTRTDDETWTLEAFPISEYPFARPPGAPDITLTPSVLTGNGLLTASDDFFDDDHVGVTFQVNGGQAKVTAVNSPTEAAVSMTSAIVVPNQVTRLTDTVQVTADPATMVGDETVTIEFKLTKDSSNPLLELELTSEVVTDPLPAGVSAEITKIVDQSSGGEVYIDQVVLTFLQGTMAQEETIEITGLAEIQDHAKVTPPAVTFGGTTITPPIKYHLDTTLDPESLPAGISSSTERVSEPLTGLEDDDAWQEQSWSDARGWPGAVLFRAQRMVLGYTPTYPSTLWGSRIGQDNFGDFLVDTLEDGPFSYTLVDATTRIVHLLPSGAFLVLTEDLGLPLKTADNLPPSSTNIPTTPETIGYGSSLRARPLKAGREILFATPDGRELRTLGYSLEADTYDSTSDLAAVAAHLLTAGGIVDMVFARLVVPAAWSVTADGRLLTAVYDRNQEVLGWAWQEDAAEYLSLSKCVGPDGKDQVWCSVRRNGGTFIERFDPALNVDSGLIQIDGAGKTAWDGLDHLEGLAVDIVADGYVMPQQVVAAGAIELPFAAQQVEIGLHYTTTIKDLPPYIEGGTGAASSVSAVHVLLYESKGCTLNGEEIPFKQFGDDLLDQPVQSFTGWKKVERLGDWSEDGSGAQVEIIQPQPLPLTVLAIAKQITVNNG